MCCCRCDYVVQSTVKNGFLIDKKWKAGWGRDSLLRSWIAEGRRKLFQTDCWRWSWKRKLIGKSRDLSLISPTTMWLSLAYYEMIQRNISRYWFSVLIFWYHSWTKEIISFTKIFLYKWYWDKIRPVQAIAPEFYPRRAMPIWKWKTKIRYGSSTYSIPPGS